MSPTRTAAHCPSCLGTCRTPRCGAWCSTAIRPCRQLQGSPCFPHHDSITWMEWLPLTERGLLQISSRSRRYSWAEEDVDHVGKSMNWCTILQVLAGSSWERDAAVEKPRGGCAAPCAQVHNTPAPCCWLQPWPKGQNKGLSFMRKRLVHIISQLPNQTKTGCREQVRRKALFS